MKGINFNRSFFGIITLITVSIKKYYSAVSIKLLLGAITLVLLGGFGILEIILNFIMSPIADYNSAYIESVQKFSIANFLKISGSIATLSVLKSSAAGFSFVFNLTIQYGNMVQPLLILLEKAWYVSFASLGVIEFTKIILLFSQKLFPVVISIALWSYILEMLFVKEKLSGYLKNIKKMFLCLSVITYLAVPLYVATMGVISQNINASLRVDIEKKLEELHQGSPNKTSTFIETSSKDYVKDSNKSYLGIESKLKNFSSDIIRYIVIELFSIVLIPASFVFFILFIFKSTMPVPENYKKTILKG